MGREGEWGPPTAESSSEGQRGFIQQLTARERMRGLSLVEVEVLRSDWFISTLSSSCSTFLAAWGSENTIFHMVTATLWEPGALSVGTPWRMARLTSLRRVLGPSPSVSGAPKAGGPHTRCTSGSTAAGWPPPHWGVCWSAPAGACPGSSGLPPP